ELREPQGSLAQEEKDASLFARIPHLSAISSGGGSVQLENTTAKVVRGSIGLFAGLVVFFHAIHGVYPLLAMRAC
ncbi:hypothetical protein SAMN04487970_1004202, partial [Paenibacillus tianmuensis]